MSQTRLVPRLCFRTCGSTSIVSDPDAVSETFSGRDQCISVAGAGSTAKKRIPLCVDLDGTIPPLFAEAIKRRVRYYQQSA